MSQGIRCPDCGAVSAPGETFCTACDTRLPVAPPPTPSSTPVSAATPTSPPPSPVEGGASDLATFLRGGGLVIGISILVVALLLCGCGGLVMDDPYRLKSLAAVLVQGDPTEGARQIQPCVTIACCLPGTLLALVGVVLALFPFGGPRGLVGFLRVRRNGFLVGGVLLLVPLFLYCVGALMLCNVAIEPSSETSSMSLNDMWVNVGVLFPCCLPGALFAISGLLIILFPFAFGRGK